MSLSPSISIPSEFAADNAGPAGVFAKSPCANLFELAIDPTIPDSKVEFSLKFPLPTSPKKFALFIDA